MRHRIRSITSALAVLVYATVSVVAVHAETLCVGSDGHIAFKGPVGGDFCHGATIEDPLRHAMGTPSRLGDCIDITLSGCTALRETDSRAFVVHPIAFVAWFLMGNTPFVELHFPARATVFDERASFARSRMAHRTAILLI